MLRYGRRHRLILYTYVVNRWWRTTLGIGIVMLALTAALGWLPSVLPQYSPLQVADWTLWLAGSSGAFAVFLAIFLVAIRKSAYVQPWDNHLLLATPFLKMKISYRRFIQASSAEVGRLFSVDDLKGRKRDFMRPLSKRTAIVLELKGLPLPRWALKLFLSPYFFPDTTPRLALLVPDWIRFSTELESFRSTWIDSQLHTGRTPQSDLLASLSEKR
jgi:hypothetical protein